MIRRPKIAIRPLVLNGICDILFGNNEFINSFIALKSDLAISLDETTFAKENKEFENVKILNDGVNVNIDIEVLNGTSIYAPLSQTGHTVIFSSQGITVSFVRLSNKRIQYTDLHDTIELSGNSFSLTENNRIL